MFRFERTIQADNWKWADIRSIKRNRMNRLRIYLKHTNPPLSARHSHTQRDFGALWSGTWAALCQLCLQWGRRGAPCTSEREWRPSEMEEKEGCSVERPRPERREKSSHKTAFLQRDTQRQTQREREKGRSRRGLLEQCPFSCRCSG